jgi:hypothetical protein
MKTMQRREAHKNVFPGPRYACVKPEINGRVRNLEGRNVEGSEVLGRLARERLKFREMFQLEVHQLKLEPWLLAWH